MGPPLHCIKLPLFDFDHWSVYVSAKVAHLGTNMSSKSLWLTNSLLCGQRLSSTEANPVSPLAAWTSMHRTKDEYYSFLFKDWPSGRADLGYLCVCLFSLPISVRPFGYCVTILKLIRRRLDQRKRWPLNRGSCSFPDLFCFVDLSAEISDETKFSFQLAGQTKEWGQRSDTESRFGFKSLREKPIRIERGFLELNDPTCHWESSAPMLLEIYWFDNLSQD